MSNYRPETTTEFDRHIKKLRSNFDLHRRLEKKIEEILEDPTHYKPLRNVLKNKRRAHIGSYVLVFEVRENEKEVVFHTFQHHDEAYKP